MCAGTACRTDELRATRLAIVDAHVVHDGAVRFGEREPCIECGLGSARRHFLDIHDARAERPRGHVFGFANDGDGENVEDSGTRMNVGTLSRGHDEAQRIELGGEGNRQPDDVLGQRQQGELRLDDDRRACLRCR